MPIFHSVGGTLIESERPVGAYRGANVKMRGVTIRPAANEDLDFLADMLWEAAAVDAYMREIGKDAALAMPSVTKYLQGWGRPGDAGLVAISEDGQRLGAAWYRIFSAESPGYGFIATDVPELSIGVMEQARGRGVGGALLDGLIGLAREGGYPALSLSVDRRNPALALYARHGFVDAGISPTTDTSVTMMIRFVSA